MIKNTICIFKN